MLGAGVVVRLRGLAAYPLGDLRGDDAGRVPELPGGSSAS